MTYLRALGDMLLRMNRKDFEKGRSYLDLTLKELFSGINLKGVDGLMGEVGELHAEILDHMLTERIMSPEEIEKAIDEANDCCISALIIVDWLRHKKAEWAKEIEAGTAEGFCPIHKRKLEFQNTLVAGTTKYIQEWVCPDCIRSEILE